MKNTYFLPLGGTGEIGMNLNLYAYGREDNQTDWIMVDMRCYFFAMMDSIPGIDLQFCPTQLLLLRSKR